jgi:hypothetical protein
MKNAENLKEKEKAKSKKQKIRNYFKKIKNGNISAQYQTSNNIKEHS